MELVRLRAVTGKSSGMLECGKPLTATYATVDLGAYCR